MRVDHVPTVRAERLSFKHMPGQTLLGKPAGSEDEEEAARNGYEYDAFEVGKFINGWIANTGGELMPLGVAISKELMPDDEFPIFQGVYGGTLRKRGVIFATNVATDLIGGPAQNMVRSLLHRMLPNIASKPKDGSGFEVPAANKLVAQFVKTVSTGMARTWMQENVGAKPKPAPVPQPVSNTPVPTGKPAAAAPPAAPAAPSADAKKGPTFLGKDVKQIGSDALQFGVASLISKVYDQVAGPVVQRTVNNLMGKGDEEVPKPKPITPGALAEGLAGAFLSGIVLRPVEAARPAPAPAATGGISGAIAGMGGLGAVMSQAMMNGLIATAFDTVYSRSLGPAIHDKVNTLAGIEERARKPAVPSGERLVRSFARSALAGGAYYLGDMATQQFFANIGGQLGGPLGALVGMAGSAVFGMTAGTVVDTLLGSAVGSAAGSLYAAVTGKPKAEDRPAAPATTTDPAAAGATAPLRRSTAPAAPANPGRAPANPAEALAAVAVARAA